MTDQNILIDTIFWACNILFDAWPILFANILVARNRLWRNLLITWILFDILRLITFFDPVPRADLLIREPLNTTVFFLTGVAFMLLYAIVVLRERPRRALAISDLRKASQLQHLSHADFITMVINLLNSAGHQAECAQKDLPHVHIRMKTAKGETCLVRCVTDEDPVQLNTVIATVGAFARERGARVMIATPYTFSDEALDWAKTNPMLLYDGQRIWDLWQNR